MQLDCTDGEIQIIPYNSYSKLIGRLEVCVNGAFTVICRDFFDDNDAIVACRQLGYSPTGLPHWNNLIKSDTIPSYYRFNIIEI